MQRVTVLEFGDRCVEKVVISEIGDVILVTTPLEWEMSKQQKREPLTVGFKKKYIVSDSRTIVENMQNTD